MTTHLRNVGIFAHVDTGKTTLAERVLFYCGGIHEIHEVRDKEGRGATMDSRPDERARGITIKSAATRIHWDERAINLIDTPGHVDFTIEVERSLRVLDGAVLVLCAVAGVQAQTGTVDRQMARHRVPCIAFVNKLDLAGADPRTVVDQLCGMGHHAELLTLPIGIERELSGIVDILAGQAVYFEGEHGQIVRRAEVPMHLRDATAAQRQRIVEAVAEVDESILEAYVGGTPVDSATLRAAIRSACIERRFTPVLCGSARGNVGVQLLLDAIVDYLPHPGEVANEAFAPDGTVVPLVADPQEPLRALAFKTVEDAFGTLTYLRVHQGRLQRGQTTRVEGRKVRLGRLVRLHASTMTDLDLAEAGDIVAMFGNSIGTAEVLTSDGASLSMRPMNVPEPVVAYAVTPKDKTMLDRFSTVLGRLCREDPTLRVRLDPNTGETLLQGMGELHLEVYCDLLRDSHGIELYRSAPRVSYRETLVRPIAFEHLHRKQDGGSGQYAKVVGQLRPSEDAYVFVDAIKGGTIAREFITACDAGFRAGLEQGPLVQAPVTGVEVVLQDGNTHERDSSDLAFRIAARDAIGHALRQAEVALLEPVATVEVDAPTEFVGAVQSGLIRRRGQVLDSQIGIDRARIEARVPLAEMFGYAGDLRGNTEGKGEFTMQVAGYERVPTRIQQQLVAHHRGER